MKINISNHSFSNLKILETVEDNVSLTERELFWIKNLQTIYPFGLNDNILGFGNVSMLGSENASHFSSENSRRYRSHGHRKPYRLRKVPVYITFNDLCKIIITPNGTNKLRNTLFNMDLQRLTTLGNSLNFIDTNNISYDDKRCYGIIKAIVFHRTHQNSKLNNKNSKIINPMYFNLTFKNEIYDKINISSIFKSKCVIKLIPKTFSNFSPTLFYSLVNSVRSKLVNYKQTINEFANNPNLPI